MKIDEVIVGDIVYHPASRKQVKVMGKDTRNEYVLIKDNEGNVIEVHCSRIQEIEDWDLDDILEREG